MERIHPVFAASTQAIITPGPGPGLERELGEHPSEALIGVDGDPVRQPLAGLCARKRVFTSPCASALHL